ncbi:MAG: hypothetical protein P4M11_05430 [Candidatus Pacebacteria bacterium]|nr:hypothetical protein [Candidatus Paceibacterota bacterium]
MPELVRVLRILKSPEAIAAEARFVRVRNYKKGNFERQCRFSFQRFVELLLNNKTSKEIGDELHITTDVVAYYYSRHCQNLSCFRGESIVERQKRILAARRDAHIKELLGSPFTSSLLSELAEIAISMGCKVTPSIVGGTKHPLAVSLRSMDIDGKTCCVHEINYLRRNRAFIQLKGESILDYDVRILCIRVPGVGKRNYVVPSSVICAKLFPNNYQGFRRLSIGLTDRRPTSGLLDARPYLNAFREIRNYP